ncbi:MAG: spondin domain-containing protein [Paraglaciecola sp.]|uniref:spondin domain-containing protein n=1 Tax=Paraglaciecola sp. TaxID=1920173 RepID=UPI00329A3B9B
MLNQFKNKPFRSALLLALPLAISACSDDVREVEVPVEVIVEVPAPEPVPVDVSYEITVTNLTKGQPVSPIAAVLHAEDDSIFTVGEVASVELEQLAESGMSEGMLSLGMTSASGTGPILPGENETVTITIQDVTDANLSITAMLGNTNDAFTGLNALDLSTLEVGDTWSGVGRAYDAGTEVNSESAETVPGPAAGGEGYNPNRTDTGYVAMHPGVVSSDDGLSTSVLTVDHKFDNPTVSIVVTRTE